MLFLNIVTYLVGLSASEGSGSMPEFNGTLVSPSLTLQIPELPVPPLMFNLPRSEDLQLHARAHEKTEPFPLALRRKESDVKDKAQPLAKDHGPGKDLMDTSNSVYDQIYGLGWNKRVKRQAVLSKSSSTTPASAVVSVTFNPQPGKIKTCPANASLINLKPFTQDAYCISTKINCMKRVMCKWPMAEDCECGGLAEGVLFLNTKERSKEKVPTPCLSQADALNKAKYCGLGQSTKPDNCEGAKKDLKIYRVSQGTKVFFVEAVSIEQTFDKILDRETGIVCSGGVILKDRDSTFLYAGPSMIEEDVVATRTTDYTLAEALCFPNMSQTQIFINFNRGLCRAPVDSLEWKVFSYWSEDTKAISSCAECWSQCERGDLIFNTPKEKNDAIVCSTLGCAVYKSASGVVTHRLTTAERMAGLTYSIEIKGSLMSTTLKQSCAKESLCETLNCYFCSELWLNPKCVPGWMFVLVGVAIFLIFLVSACLLWALLFACGVFRTIFCCCFTVSKKISKKTLQASQVKYSELMRDELEEHRQQPNLSRTYQPATPSRKETEQEARGRRINQVRALLNIAIVTLILLPAALASDCVSITSYNVKSTECQSVGQGGRTCKTKEVIKFDLPPHAGKACLTLLDTGSVLKELSVNVLSYTLRCQRRTQYFTRDGDFKTASVRRCSGAGQCSEGFSVSCKGFKETTEIEFLPEGASEYPGTSHCSPAPGCLAEGCGYCTSSCLFWRLFFKPKSTQTYEVFTCPEWVESTKVEIEVGGAKSVVSLIRGIPHTVGSLEITHSRGPEIVAPILSSSFLKEGSNVALTESCGRGEPQAGKVGQVQCEDPTMAGNLKGCKLAKNPCMCNPGSKLMLCSCTQTDLSLRMSGENRLPLLFQNGILKMWNNELHLEFSSRNGVSLDVKMMDGLPAVVKEVSSCSGLFSPVSGCFNCITGAILNYTCTSDKSNILASVRCEGMEPFPISCQVGAPVHRQVRLSISDRIFNRHCKVECPGGGFEADLRGALDYSPLTDYQSTSMSDSYSSVPSQMWGALWSLDIFKAVFSVGATAVGIVLAIGTVILGKKVAKRKMK